MHSSRRYVLLEDRINQQGFAALGELAELCGVSEQTIRRDLMKLSREGRIVRLRGGGGNISQDSPFEVRRNNNVEGKKIIGSLLASLIPNRATMFTGGGTTLECAARYLAHKEGLFVLTANLHVALALQQCRHSTILVPHGRLQKGTHALLGDTIRECIARYRMDFCLISTAAVSPSGTFFEFDSDIAATIAAMRQNARHTILAADHSKFLRNGVVRVGNLSDIDTLVTDVRPPAQMCSLLEQANVRLICP